MSGYLVEPEVAGGLGENSVLDDSTTPLTVLRLHYAVDGWLGGQLLETWPAWIATKAFVRAVTDAALSGFETGEAEVTLSQQGRDVLGEIDLPPFVRFVPTGSPGRDDFAVTADGLQVSERALAVIRPLLGPEAIVEPLP